MEGNLIGIGECRCCHQTQTLNAPVSTIEAVRDMGVETAQIKLDGGVVAKFKVKDGAVVITRAYKSERQRSI